LQESDESTILLMFFHQGGGMSDWYSILLLADKYFWLSPVAVHAFCRREQK
jgi:hypothetical protein